MKLSFKPYFCKEIENFATVKYCIMPLKYILNLHCESMPRSNSFEYKRGIKITLMVVDIKLPNVSSCTIYDLFIEAKNIW